MYKRTRLNFDPNTGLVGFAVAPYNDYPEEALDWHHVHLGEMLVGLGVTVDDYIRLVSEFTLEPENCRRIASIPATEPEADDHSTVELAAGKPYPFVVLGSLN